MTEMGKFEAYKKKLQGVCDENKLVYTFVKSEYPITLTIKPTDNGQLSMIDEGGNERSPDAYIRFSYIDGDIDITTSETFTIGDNLFQKLKNLFKNMYSCWTQYFFRCVIERELIDEKTMTDIEGTDFKLPEGAEPFEEIVEDPIDEEDGDDDE